jgi:hypothetical protein
MVVAAPEAPDAIRDVDALFVLNQDASLPAVASLSGRNHYRTVVVLTTHEPFADEAARLRELAADVGILTVADLLDDQEMAACDEQATRECTARVGERAVRMRYSGSFMRRSLALKNERAYRNLTQRFRPAAIHFSDGLGIDGPSWEAVGGAPVASSAAVAPAGGLVARARRLIATTRAGVRSAPSISVLSAPSDSRAFIFVGTTRRLRLVEGCRAAPVTDRWLSSMWPVASRAPQLYARVFERAVRRTTQQREWALCTTIHEYRPALSILAGTLGRELLIFVDGYHPSNYPRSYLDMFLSGTFVSSSVISSRWFERHGRRVRPPFVFQQSERFAPCTTTTVEALVLVMNHAGDWTALINRSDSDRLIGAYAELAKQFPRLQLILRLHPTMAHPAHEGVHSVERISRHIESLRLPNLALSRASLDEDLARGHLFLSEYSQVLIDVWRSGKLGLAVNLTRRRSFMADYEQLGFAGVSGFDQLREIVAALPDRIAHVVARQNEAANSLNRLQDEWERRLCNDKEAQ